MRFIETLDTIKIRDNEYEIRTINIPRKQRKI